MRIELPVRQIEVAEVQRSIAVVSQHHPFAKQLFWLRTVSYCVFAKRIRLGALNEQHSCSFPFCRIIGQVNNYPATCPFREAERALILCFSGRGVSSRWPRILRRRRGTCLAAAIFSSSSSHEERSPTYR